MNIQLKKLMEDIYIYMQQVKSKISCVENHLKIARN